MIRRRFLMWLWLLIFPSLVFAQTAPTVYATGANITQITWTPPTLDTNGNAITVTGYKLCIDAMPGSDVGCGAVLGATPQAPVPPASLGPHSLTVRAIDSSGESTDSNVLAVVYGTPPISVPQPPALAFTPVTIGVGQNCVVGANVWSIAANQTILLNGKPTNLPNSAVVPATTKMVCGPKSNPITVYALELPTVGNNYAVWTGTTWMDTGSAVPPQ